VSLRFPSITQCLILFNTTNISTIHFRGLSSPNVPGILFQGGSKLLSQRRKLLWLISYFLHAYICVALLTWRHGHVTQFAILWVAVARGSSDAISYLLQIQGRDGRYVVGFCTVQVLLVTVPPYWLFDTNAKSKYGADALHKVLSNAPDSRSWINTKLYIQSVT